MQLKDLRQFVASLPEEFNDFELVNGAYGFIEKHGEDNVYYRRDYSICVATVDETSKEVVFLHQSQDEIDTIKYGDS